MTAMSMIVTTKMMKSMSPMTVAISLLAISILSSTVVFKGSLSSWMPFVLILTFSSGMMTLFIYVTSLSPNEKTKTKKSMVLLTLPMLILVSQPNTNAKMMKESMKAFSSNVTMIIMATILLASMLAIAMHTYNPMQSMYSSF
uniref:NADH dehydrogenase subunit 6 n=1 Tax=Oribatula sp. XFX TaxID=2652662 RepID=A0A5J6VF99_9ACAR|nr:NADH dehydrogenase subunit 6 [Oribatula sp. XFX]